MSYQGWDYTEPPREYCDCKQPVFDKAGICRTCGRQLKGITLDVQSVTSKLKFVWKQGEQNG